MPKFYVKSGRLRWVIDRPDALVAAFAVVRGHAFNPQQKIRGADTVSQLGLLTTVSERGFRGKDGESYSTHCILMAEGPFEKFRWQA